MQEKGTFLSTGTNRERWRKIQREPQQIKSKKKEKKKITNRKLCLLSFFDVVVDVVARIVRDNMIQSDVTTMNTGRNK